MSVVQTPALPPRQTLAVLVARPVAPTTCCRFHVLLPRQGPALCLLRRHRPGGTGGARLLGLCHERRLAPRLPTLAKWTSAPPYPCSGSACLLGLRRERGLVSEAAEAREQDERGAGRQRGEGPPKEAPDVARVRADRDVRQPPRDRVAVRQDDACADAGWGF